MKKLSVLFCGLMLAVLPSTLHAQQVLYKIDKITPTIIETPRYQAGSAAHEDPNPIGKWLEIEVQFEAVPELTDEMTVKYFAQVNGILLSGEVTHVDIPKGRELYSVMYVSPRTLARLLGANKTATTSIIGDVGVQLLVK